MRHRPASRASRCHGTDPAASRFCPPDLPPADSWPMFVAVIPIRPIGGACAMRLHPVWGLILFFLAALATTSLAFGADPPRGAPAEYQRRDIEGFTVYVKPDVLLQKFDRFGRQPLGPLERELNDLRRILVPK